MSSYQKRADFVNTKRLKNEPVEAVNGIGDAGKRVLEKQDIIYAYQLLGLYLRCGRDTRSFESQLQFEYGLYSKSAKHCAECLEEWCVKNA